MVYGNIIINGNRRFYANKREHINVFIQRRLITTYRAKSNKKSKPI